MRYFFGIENICPDYQHWHLFHIGMIFESILFNGPFHSQFNSVANEQYHLF